MIDIPSRDEARWIELRQEKGIQGYPTAPANLPASRAARINYRRPTEVAERFAHVQ